MALDIEISASKLRMKNSIEGKSAKKMTESLLRWHGHHVNRKVNIRMKDQRMKTGKHPV